MGTQSSSSFLCSGHLLITTWQSLKEITRNTNANKTRGSVVPHSPLLQVVECRFQKDKTQTNLRTKTSKKMKRNLHKDSRTSQQQKSPSSVPYPCCFSLKSSDLIQILKENLLKPLGLFLLTCRVWIRLSISSPRLK